MQIYGLDVNRSIKFWAPYLEFEQEVLKEMQADPNTPYEEIDKQNARIRSIYRRRVIFPTSDMLMTWNEYQEWETDSAEL